MGAKQAVNPLLDLIKQNQDQDVYLRHAAVLALSRIGLVEPIAALATSTNRSLRIAAVLVLRRLKNPAVAQSCKIQMNTLLRRLRVPFTMMNRLWKHCQL